MKTCADTNQGIVILVAVSEVLRPAGAIGDADVFKLVNRSSPNARHIQATAEAVRGGRLASLLSDSAIAARLPRRAHGFQLTNTAHFVYPSLVSI
jgi:hypothetical protein